jgi:FG-GAP-like repeat/Abnormal spindle-like microcephaly-assoc'd, ASPM-SPD-2-Hydin
MASPPFSKGAAGRANQRIATMVGRIVLLLYLSSAPLFAQFETRVAYPVLESPQGIVVGDFNHDGKLDMAVASLYSTQVSVLLGNGDGTFRPAVQYASGPGPRWMVAADINGDGNLDLAVADFATTPNNVAVLLGNGDGTFQAPTFLSVPGIPSGIAVGEFNGDKKLDLAVTNWVIGSQPYLSVFLGNGDGSFQPPINNLTSATPLAVAVGDFSGDGKLDAAVGENNVGSFQLQILLGNGDGTFGSGQIYGLVDEVSAVVAADFRNDGKIDLAAAGILGPGVQVLLGNGDGTFQTPVNYLVPSSYSIAVADLNGDGKLDMAVANFGGPNGNQSDASVLLGNGDGTFQPAANYPIGKLSTFVAVGDFNNDKMPDLVLTDRVDSDVIELLNTGVVSFSPTNPVSFATQLVGTTSVARAVTLTNTGATALTISSMHTSGPFTTKSSCGSSVAAGAKCQINVTFSPTSQRQASGLITLRDSASSKPQIIELNGIATVAEVQPGSLKFGTQTVETKSAPQPVTLTNTGSTAMSITQITVYELNYTDFLETNNCPSSLPAKSSCTINVTFDPVKKGARTATLYVTDSGGGSPQSVSLSGTGAE